MASALASGSAAVTLQAASRGVPDATLHRLGMLESAASLGEMAMLTGYLAQSGKTARPLTTGRFAAPFWLGAVAAGTLLPLLLHQFGRRRDGRSRRSRSNVPAVRTTARPLVLRRGVVEAGSRSLNAMAGHLEPGGDQTAK